MTDAAQQEPPWGDGADGKCWSYWEHYSGITRDQWAHAQECVRRLPGLLAVIHRDGGHHTDSVGLDDSIDDAHAAVAELRDRAERAEAGPRGMSPRQIREFDAALAETGRLLAELATTREALAEAKSQISELVFAGDLLYAWTITGKNGAQKCREDWVALIDAVRGRWKGASDVLG